MNVFLVIGQSKIPITQEIQKFTLGALCKLINTLNNIYVIWDKQEMKGPTIYNDVEFTPRCVDPNDNDVGSIVVVIWILVMVNSIHFC